MTKKKNSVNENYIHACDCARQALNSYSSINDLDYSADELKSIFDFYLFNAPVKKDSKSRSIAPIRWLGDYGWKGNGGLGDLERRLLKASNIQSFVVIKSDSIDATLEAMNLSGEICTSHPRAVLKSEFSVSVREDGSVSVSSSESRMVCLFRHIRNSLAHGLTYVFSPDMLLLEDRNEDRVSARILISKQTLIEWRKVVISGLELSKEESA